MKYIFHIFINRIIYNLIFEYDNNDDIGRVRDSGD